MNAKERDIISYFLAIVESEGKAVEWIVDELSSSDKKFKQVFEDWQGIIANGAWAVAEYHRRMADEFGFDYALLKKEVIEKRSNEIIGEIKAQYNNSMVADPKSKAL